MNRIDIINSLITKNKYKSYVELGVQAGHCFSAINCEKKIGVDPDQSSAATLKITADEFFETNTDTYDIFFVDSLHHAENCERDILNALKFLNPGGTIVCHDMEPTDEFMTLIPHTTQDCWTGNVYKTWIKLRTTREDLTMNVVSTDWGVGIIQVGKQTKLNISEEINFTSFQKNKKAWMPMVTISEFIQKYLV
jgi:hypothetical protein